MGLLSLPRDIEPHPESGDMIQAGIGRFGPYLKYQGKFTSLPPEDDVLEIGINRAVDLLAEAAKLGGFLASTQLVARYMSRKVDLDPMSSIINSAPPWARRMI